MQTPEKPENESARLEALVGCAILDTEPEENFDRLTRLAQNVFGTEIALISLVDASRQWFKSKQGLDASETDRSISFCGHAILDDEIFEICDAQLDPRFQDNPLVTGPPHIRFYAGAPIKIHSGFNIGTLCIIDSKPKKLQPHEYKILADLAACVADEIDTYLQQKEQDSLQQAKHQLANVYELLERSNEAARIGTWEVNLTTLQVYWSSVTKQIHQVPDDFSCSLEETMKFFKPGKSRESIQQAFTKAIDEGIPYDIELTLITATGNERWVRAIGFPQFKQSECQRIYGLYQDISENKQNELALEAMNQRMTLAADSARFGVWEWNLVTNELIWDDWMYRLYGITRNDFSGAYDAWENGLHPDDKARATAEIQLALEGTIDFNTEFRVLHPSGNVRYIKASGLVIRDDKGNAIRMIGVNYDITANKLAEISLKENARYTQTLIDNIVDGIITFNETGNVNSANPAILDIFGYDRNEIKEQSIHSLIPNLDKNIFNSHKKTAYKIDGHHKNGDLIPIELIISRITHQGKPMHLCLIRDTTEQRRIENMKSEFVSVVSHELRTPLTSISGALSLLSSGALRESEEQSQEMIKIAHKNSQRLTFLINDLLDMEKLAAGKMYFDMQTYDLKPLLKQAIQVNQAYGCERNIDITLECKIKNIKIQTDQQRFIQVLSNLLSNAIKYSPDGETVAVTVTYQNNNARISIKDNGPGISPEFQKHIFSKFAQADSSDTRKKGGSGLGLAITRSLTEHMRGEISFDSTPGEGSTFHLDLPITNLHELEDQFPKLSRNQAHNIRILIAENEPETAEMLEGILTVEGYMVDTSNTGAEALAALRWSKYDALILDLGLIDVSALELIHEIYQRYKTSQLPIIAISSKQNGTSPPAGYEELNISWMSKPVDPIEFVKNLEQALSKRRETRPRILHIEDDEDIHHIFKTAIDLNFDLELATSLSAARKRIEKEIFDAFIVDASLPDGSGWEFASEIQSTFPKAGIILLSGSDIPRPKTSQHLETVLVKSKTTPLELMDVLQQQVRPQLRAKGMPL